MMHPQRVLREAGRRRRGVGRPMRRAGVVSSAGKERPEWGCHFVAIDVYKTKHADAGKQPRDETLCHYFTSHFGRLLIGVIFSSPLRDCKVLGS